MYEFYFFQFTSVDVSVNFQKIKPKGKMSQDEMLKLISNFAKQKRIKEEWKLILIDDAAWKIDLQQPSPVKKMFDPKEVPFKNEKKTLEPKQPASSEKKGSINPSTEIPQQNKNFKRKGSTIPSRM